MILIGPNEDAEIVQIPQDPNRANRRSPRSSNDPSIEWCNKKLRKRFWLSVDLSEKWYVFPRAVGHRMIVHRVISHRLLVPFRCWDLDLVERVRSHWTSFEKAIVPVDPEGHGPFTRTERSFYVAERREHTKHGPDGQTDGYITVWGRPIVPLDQHRYIAQGWRGQHRT